MLKQLEITNYALIRHTSVSMEHGFTVITGETGAGKSILLEALGLVLGSRANFNAIRKGEEKCVIEARFEYKNESLDAVLHREALDVLSDVILRRELTSSGRSRAFVNDSPVNISVLKEISGSLVDMHGQQENLSLQTPSYQVRQLDLFSRNQKTFEAFSDAFKTFRSLDRQLNQLRDAAAQVRKDEDYFQFQFEELIAVELDPEVFHGLENELSALEHAEDIQRSLAIADAALDGGGDGGESALSILRKVVSELRAIEGFTDPLKELSERIVSAVIELEDLQGECTRIANAVEYNPERLEVVRDQIDQMQRLLHKHGVQSVDALKEVREEYQIKLDGIASYEDELADLEEKVSAASIALNERAKALSESRKSAVELYVKRLMEQVRKLGMEKATIDVRLVPLETTGQLGNESVEMWFDANGDKHLVPLKDSASGGEVSRLMLALKSILAENDRTPTLIFDEIDTGVSGEIAKQIGVLMRSISAHTQIIAVTHLPGVAAKGEHHLQIAKREADGQVLSGLRVLEKMERIQEIAGMFSGNALNQASLESARNLLEEK
ncbi:MAG: DNA repair protein RecN [Flavobacteriales bacterium]|nr:DNA repair protein RecN [Flavobacteriales bacterium]